MVFYILQELFSSFQELLTAKCNERIASKSNHKYLLAPSAMGLYRTWILLLALYSNITCYGALDPQIQVRLIQHYV